MSTPINVAFSDESASNITSVFAGPQPLESFPFQAEIGSDDARYVAFHASVTALFPDTDSALVTPGD